VNEAACDEAVLLARQNPRLGVGLHLTLLCGHSALPARNIPHLINGQQEFANNPAAVGFRYFFQRSLREELRAEIHEQFRKFKRTGLELDHVNGHLNLHLHPTVFDILMENAERLGIKRVRLTRDPFWLNLHLASGRLPYRIVHAIIFTSLSARVRTRLKKRGILHVSRVFGLLQNARVDEEFTLRLVDHLPAGDSELYSHPSLNEFKREFDALISPRVRKQIEDLGIELIRYQDL
jgi:hopanoid biosynthesis associated protein HpnK